MARQELGYYEVLDEVVDLVRNNKFLLNKVETMVKIIGFNPNWDLIGDIAYEVTFNFGYKNPSKTQIKKSILLAIKNIIAKHLLMKNYKEVDEEELHSFVYEEFPF